MDLAYRHMTAGAAREIKASAHYAYVTNGITLDGSKFATAELVLEGQCLVMDNATKKYEKYADGVAAAAVITGAANVTPADTTLNAGTSVAFIIDGVSYVMSNTALDALAATTTAANVVAAIGNAVDAAGNKLSDVANCSLASSKAKIAIKDADTGHSIKFVGTWGATEDKALIEGIFGIADGAAATGAGVFPAGKSNPVILDESVQFKLTDAGANPDVTVGQVMVHGAVYLGMLKNCTAAFRQALAGAIRFV